MPWVGGELARGALANGRETFGVDLLRGWAAHLRRYGGAQVWYWPAGQPGFRTTNEVNYTGWGMSEWVNALVEGLAGVRDQDCLLRQVSLSPRWAAAGVRQAAVWVRYAASKGYAAYRFTAAEDGIRLEVSGSGSQAAFHVLLPEGRQPARVTAGGVPLPFTLTRVDQSHYVDFDCNLSAGALLVQIEFSPQ